MLWQLLLLAAALGAAYYRWSRRRLYRLARELPLGLTAYPIIGHAYLAIGSYTEWMERCNLVGEIANKQGGLTSAWLGIRLYIIMTDPEAIAVVTKTCLEKDDYTVRFTREVIGNGSIFAPVNIWRSRRKIAAPFFKWNNLKQLVPMFHANSSLMADLMTSEVGGGDFSIWKYMTTYTFDTIFENTIGMKMKSQENPENTLLHALENGLKLLAERILQPWLHLDFLDFIYERLPVHKQFQSIRDQCYTYADEVIKTKRKKEFASIKTRSKEKNLINMLDIVMQTARGQEKGFSDIELREEGITMVIADNDTSAACLSFTAVLLSRYPDVQDKVYRELEEVFGDSDSAITGDNLVRLKYLEAVIKESLRLYPPGPVIVREVHNDVVLPSGTTLVEGTGVMINIWATHRNPLYWGADAELFRPERFLEGPLRHPAQFIPFSYSVRDCVGRTYAMLLIKTALINLVRRYRLLPPADMAAADRTKPLPVEFGLTLKAADNFILRVEKRIKSY